MGSVIAVVGESSSGKSVYLKYLSKYLPNAYLLGISDSRLFPIDEKLKEQVFGEFFEKNFFDKDMARVCANDVCRTCDTLLVDEIGTRFSIYDDGCEMCNYIADVGRYKDVVYVTHDISKLYSADRVVTVEWIDNKPVTQEITLEEAEKYL